MKAGTRILCAGLTLLLGGLVAYGDTASIIPGGDTRYQTLRLTPEIYSRANPDLSDLRIWDGQGRQVPYFVHNYTVRGQTVSKQYAMKTVSRFQKDEMIYVDLALEQPMPPNTDLVATGLSLRTPPQTVFAGEVSLQGSHDGANWNDLEGDTLYQVDGNQKLTLPFGGEQKYTFYRVGFSQRMEQLQILGASLHDDRQTLVKSSFQETLRPAYTVEQREQETVVVLQGMRNLRVAGILLETDSLFQRQVNAMGQSDTLYNLSFENTSYSRLELPMDGKLCREDALELRIRNNDDRPIELDGIAVSYYADELVFESGEGLTLEFGADAAKTAPVYDIASYSSRILQENSLSRATLGEIVYVAATVEQPQEKDYTQLFTWTLAAITALLMTLILLRLKKVKPEE